MIIKDRELHNFADFELDKDAITLHTTHKNFIDLPYSGALPEGFEDTQSAFIRVVMDTIGQPSLSVHTAGDGWNETLPIDMTKDETRDLLYNFFFKEDGHTRMDCGLDKYLLGVFQARFLCWMKLAYEPLTVLPYVVNADDLNKVIFLRHLTEDRIA